MSDKFTSDNKEIMILLFFDSADHLFSPQSRIPNSLLLTLSFPVALYSFFSPIFMLPDAFESYTKWVEWRKISYFECGSTIPVKRWFLWHCRTIENGKQSFFSPFFIHLVIHFFFLSCSLFRRENSSDKLYLLLYFLCLSLFYSQLMRSTNNTQTSFGFVKKITFFWFD